MTSTAGILYIKSDSSIMHTNILQHLKDFETRMAALTEATVIRIAMNRERDQCAAMNNSEKIPLSI